MNEFFVTQRWSFPKNWALFKSRQTAIDENWNYDKTSVSTIFKIIKVEKDPNSDNFYLLELRGITDNSFWTFVERDMIYKGLELVEDINLEKYLAETVF